jgi:cytochrome P450
MLAATPQAVRRPLEFLTDTLSRYGPVVALPAGPGALHVAEPALVHEVLITRAADYVKRTPQYDALARVTGNGILVSDDPPWRTRRRVLQPAFHRRLLDRVQHEAVTTADALVAAWAKRAPGGPVDVVGGADAAMSRMVRRALFAAGPEREVRKVIQASLAASAGIVDGAVVPVGLAERVPSPARHRARRLLAELDRSMASLVSARLAGDIGDDALGLLLHASSEGLVDAEAVPDEVVTLVLAGQETAASSLAWACLLLAENPAWQHRVRTEAARVLVGDRWDHTDLPIARAVVDEVLRLYPPAWVISRRARVDTRVGDVDLPAGAFVIMSPYVIHRRAELWPEPAGFDPGRWVDAPRPASGAYVPFGLGSRMCVGRDMAHVEATAMLARLMQGVEIFQGGQRRPRATAAVTLRPRDRPRRAVRLIGDR